MLPFLSMASGFGPANGVRFGVRRALPRSTQASPGTNRIYVTQCNAMQCNAIHQQMKMTSRYAASSWATRHESVACWCPAREYGPKALGRATVSLRLCEYTTALCDVLGNCVVASRRIDQVLAYDDAVLVLDVARPPVHLAFSREQAQGVEACSILRVKASFRQRAICRFSHRSKRCSPTTTDFT
jgi:hypothetical protein